MSQEAPTLELIGALEPAQLIAVEGDYQCSACGEERFEVRGHVELTCKIDSLQRLEDVCVYDYGIDDGSAVIVICYGCGRTVLFDEDDDPYDGD